MTRTRKIAIAAVVAAVASTAGAATLYAAQERAEDTIATGYWEYRTRLLGFLPVDREYRCVTPDDVDDFFTGPCNRHHTCTYPVREVADGRARFEGYWIAKSDGDRANVKATGEYSEKRFVLNARGTLTNGLPLQATIDARWISETCPANAPR